MGFNLLIIFTYALLVATTHLSKKTNYPLYLDLFVFFIFIIQLFVSQNRYNTFFFIIYLFALFTIFVKTRSSMVPIFSIYILTFLHSTVSLLNSYFVTDNIYFLYPIILLKAKTMNSFLNQQNISALITNMGAILSFYFFAISSNRTKKILLYFLHIYFMYIGITTTSRASALGLVLALIIMGYLYFKKGNKNYKYIVISLVIYFILFYLYSNFISPYMFNKFLRYNMIKTKAIDSRINIWIAQLLMFLDKPIFGWGFENFRFFNYPYQLEAQKITKVGLENIGYFTYGHNEFLQLLVEGGLVFFIPLCWLFYKASRKIFTSIKSYDIPILGIIILYLTQFAFEWEFRFPLTGLIFTLMLARLFHNKNWLISAAHYRVSFFNRLTVLRYFYTVILCSGVFLLTMSLIYQYPKIVEMRYTQNPETLLEVYSPIFSPFTKYESNKKYLNLHFNKFAHDIFGEYLKLSKQGINKETYKKLMNFDNKEQLYKLVKITDSQLKEHEIWFYHLYLGFWYTLLKNYDAAQVEYFKAIKLNPASEMPFFYLGINSRLKHSNNYEKFYSLLPDDNVTDKLMEKMTSDFGKDTKKKQILFE